MPGTGYIEASQISYSVDLINTRAGQIARRVGKLRRRDPELASLVNSLRDEAEALSHVLPRVPAAAA